MALNIRKALARDMPGITAVRTSVRENHLSVEQMAERGISEERTIAEMEAGDLGCWVAEARGQIVAFSMGDRRNGNVFALFTLHDFEGRGYGSALLSCCEDDLKACGFSNAHLDTASDTNAHRFYLRRGWQEYKKSGGNAYLMKPSEGRCCSADAVDLPRLRAFDALYIGKAGAR